MLYHLVKKWRGNEEVVMTDELSKINDRMKTLKKGSRNGIKGQKVNFFIKPAEKDVEKYYKEPQYRNGRDH